MTYFTDLAATLTQIDPAPLLPFVRDCAGTLWVAGNGGSAAVAQHWACDLSKAAGRRVQALGANPAVLSAYTNDIDHRNALRLEFERLARKGDRVICLSCSGTSSNIAKLIGIATFYSYPIALITGEPKEYEWQPDLLVHIPSQDYGILEDCFSAIGHWLTKELQG